MDIEKTVTYLAIVAGGIGIVIIGLILNGWALSVLWGWFIVPVFDAPRLTIAQSIGVAVVIGQLVTSPKKAKDDRDRTERIIDAVAYCLIAPLLTVAIGWLILQFS